MICTTIRNGQECAFMTQKGCAYNGGSCHGLVEQCQGCNRTLEVSGGWYCNAYPEPAVRWKHGRCHLASHVAADAVANSAKINPLKASKRNNR